MFLTDSQSDTHTHTTPNEIIWIWTHSGTQYSIVSLCTTCFPLFSGALTFQQWRLHSGSVLGADSNKNNLAFTRIKWPYLNVFSRQRIKSNSWEWNVFVFPNVKYDFDFGKSLWCGNIEVVGYVQRMRVVHEYVKREWKGSGGCESEIRKNSLSAGAKEERRIVLIKWYPTEVRCNWIN